jgi:hypothetical protein
MGTSKRPATTKSDGDSIAAVGDLERHLKAIRKDIRSLKDDVRRQGAAIEKLETGTVEQAPKADPPPAAEAQEKPAAKEEAVDIPSGSAFSASRSVGWSPEQRRNVIAARAQAPSMAQADELRLRVDDPNVADRGFVLTRTATELTGIADLDTLAAGTWQVLLQFDGTLYAVGDPITLTPVQDRPA